jgi:hypothetical protein
MKVLKHDLVTFKRRDENVHNVSEAREYAG